MTIRPYRPGDEEAQVRIYNAGAGALPFFQPAKLEDVARRDRAGDTDPSCRFYAVEGGEVVGYALFNPSGRISFPWCLPEATHCRVPLLEAVLSAMRERGLAEAWAAYRGDWSPVLIFFDEHGFVLTRLIFNYVAELSRLPRAAVPEGRIVAPLERGELAEVRAMEAGIFPEENFEALEEFYLRNPYFAPDSLFVVKGEADGGILGAAQVIDNPEYADPTKLDGAMPCFRLGTLGTERERHKRVRGMFSCLFTDEATGEVLLAEAARRMERAGLTHAAAQVSSTPARMADFYDRFFTCQGGFPILSRRLSAR